MVMELAAVLPAIGAAAAICEVLFLVFGELGRRKGNETEKKEGGIRMGGRAVHSISVATFWDAWRAVDAEDASREIVRVIARLFQSCVVYVSCLHCSGRPLLDYPFDLGLKFSHGKCTA
jgi:hypothetical protein